MQQWSWQCWETKQHSGDLIQSLEFVETRILAEMKIENRGKIFSVGEKINKHAFFFFYENKGDGSVNANWRYKADIRHEF